MADLSSLKDSELLAMYAMPALIHQESGGRAGVKGPQTRYGQAEGMTQMLPATAKATAQKIGMAWRPELMTGDSPEAAEYQRALGQAYLQEGIEATGGLEGGLKYYHGGPNRDLWGPKTEDYSQSVMGRLGQGGSDLASLSNDQLMAMYQGGQAPAAKPEAPQLISRSQNGGVTVETAPGEPPVTRRDQGLGFQKGAMKPLDNGAMGLEWLASKVGLDKPINALGDALGMPSTREAMGDRAAYLEQQRAKGVVPGKIGEFVGNIAGTLPLGMIPGGPLAQGAVSGAALTDARDAGGVLKDAAIGGVAGRLTAGLTDAVQIGARKALSKAPKILSLPELEAAKRAAYKAVDDAGFTFGRRDIKAMADDFAKTVGSSALSKAAKEDAASIIQYTRGLAKGDVSLSQLEKLRGDIYAAMVKKGGDTGAMGQAFRAKIDALMDTADSAAVKNARELNARFAKAGAVTKRLDSADLAKRRAYTGSNGDNAIRQKLSPLIDPLHSARLRNATPDEAKALDRVVTGSAGQNIARTVGALADPRRGIPGASLLTSVLGAGHTGGLSLGLMPLGMGATALANRQSQKNVENLLQLIAAGGSKEALRKVPTRASYAAERAVAAVRPAAGLIGASAASRAHAADKKRRKP